MNSQENEPVLTNSMMSDGDSDRRLSGGHLRAVYAAGSLKHRRNKEKKRKKMSTFERRYTALGPLTKPDRKRIDYVLVHKNKSSKDATSDEERETLLKREDMRSRFEKAVEAEGFSLSEEVIEDYVYKKLHCPFKRLCQEAEHTKLEMPLKGVS